MDVKSLKQLVALYEEGSVTQAAKLLHISQPALTAQLSRLEYKLGSKLFFRSVKGLEPTLMGKTLYERSKRILAHWSAFDSEVKLISGSEIGQIRLSCGAAIEQSILPNVIIDFFSHFPKVNLDVSVINPEKMLARLQTGEADIAMGGFNTGVDHDFEEIRFKSQRIGFYVRPEHPLCKNKKTLKSFGKFKLGCPEIPITAKEWFTKRGFTTERGVYSNSYSLIKSVTKKSDLIAAGPEFLFQEEVAKGELRKLLIRQTPNWEGAILVPRTSLPSQHIQILIKCLQKEIGAFSAKRS